LSASGFANFAVIAGVFITAFYSFRMYFLVFHGKERYDQMPHDPHHDNAHDDHAHDDHGHGHHGPFKPHESPWVVTLPLILLAIPSVIIGYIAIEPMVFGEFFKGVITIAPQHTALATFAEEFHGAAAMGMHAFSTLPFWLASGGVVAAAVCYLFVPAIPAAFMKFLKPIHTLLDNKYYMDKFNEVVFAGGARGLGQLLWQVGDRILIDGLLVNGSARLVGMVSGMVRFAQSGFIYHYAFAMILGVLAMVIAFVSLKY
jgi:NADH-quinone oxidoreductase subunit L